jgi:hypothetical protein
LSSLFRDNGENSYDACFVGKNKLYYARHLAESLWQAETKIFDEKTLSLPSAHRSRAIYRGGGSHGKFRDKSLDYDVLRGNERLVLVCMGVLCLM